MSGLVEALGRALASRSRSAPGAAEVGEASSDLAAGALDRAAEIAVAIDSLAGDLLGLAPLLADPRVGGLVEARLGDVLTDLRRLARDVETIIEPWVHAQCAPLAARLASDDLRINLTGSRPIPGWITVGGDAADINVNLQWSLPFADASVRFVFFAMGIEHFRSSEVPAIVREIARVLAPGGVVRIVTLDAERYLRACCEDDRPFLDAQAEHWPWTASLATPLEHLLAWTGASREAGHFFEHKWAYDFSTLSHLLESAGLSGVVRSAFMASEHPELRVDDNSADAGASFEGRSYALFVEAHA